MIFLSFNVRGVGGAPKKLALKRMFLSLKPDIIMIQETMCPSDKAREIFSPWLRNWSFSTIDASGLSTGLLTGWSPNFQALSSSVVLSSISVKLKHKNSDLAF
jgi:ABC-type uncharacterized transport system YnjBCD ATPase subunit